MAEVRGTQRLSCFGLGYSARVLAFRLVAEGWEVRGTAREPEAAVARAPGCATYRFDREHRLPRAAFDGITHILVSVPPDAAPGATVDPVLDAHGDDIAALPGLAWLGYLSTTGVYGDCGGFWVAEFRAAPERRAREAARPGRDWMARSGAPPGRAGPYLPACRDLRPRPLPIHGAARGHRKAHPEAGAGVLAHPCRGSRERARRLDRAAMSRRDL